LRNMFKRIESMVSYHRSVYLILTFCYIGVIFYLSSLPESSLSSGNSTIEKIFWNFAHIPLYAILAILLSYTLRNRNKSNYSFFKSNWNVLIIALCIAIFDELNQARIPGRNASLTDILLDSIGIIIALWIITMKKVKAQL
jgi:VanZ family protein